MTTLLMVASVEQAQGGGRRLLTAPIEESMTTLLMVASVAELVNKLKVEAGVL